MPQMERQTTLCYIERGDKTLMLYRNKKKDDANAGKWIAVGGGFEFGESPEECMLREVREETGYALETWAYRGIVTFLAGDWGEHMHLFTAKAPEGEPCACDEGTFAWIATDELNSLPAWEGDRIFTRLLRERETFFSLKLVYDDSGAHLERAILDGKEMAL